MFGLSKLVDQIGQTKDLDTFSKPLSDVVSKATAPDAVKTPYPERGLAINYTRCSQICPWGPGQWQALWI